MRRYLVQRCDEDGKAKGAPLEIYAASEIKAAEVATQMKLRPRGKSREVRARVRWDPATRRRLSRSLPHQAPKHSASRPASSTVIRTVTKRSRPPASSNGQLPPPLNQPTGDRLRLTPTRELATYILAAATGLASHSCALTMGDAPRLRDSIPASLSAIRSARSAKSGCLLSIIGARTASTTTIARHATQAVAIPIQMSIGRSSMLPPRPIAAQLFVRIHERLRQPQPWPLA